MLGTAEAPRSAEFAEEKDERQRAQTRENKKRFSL
jgi:hypothetical protein